ncbi:MAG: hypothetical protein IJW14_01355 [Oscillospiraceae bacterium]|nr:hypothetical protein [Oscillospiraceae bacterium]
MKSTFARRISILLVLAMVLAMLPLGAMAATPTTLYLKPGPWNTANAWFSAYFYAGETNTHAAMADTDGDGVYEVTVPEGDWTNVIFLRNDPADQVADWTSVWNQTADLDMPTDSNNMYTVTGWNAGDGAWSEYVYVEPAFYVCGTMNSWTLSYADHKMVKGDDGVYSLTLTLAAGNYEFKVNDGTWNSSWGKDGGSNNIEFVLTEESNVTITFDVATKVPTVTSSALGEVETFDYYLRGSMNEWSVSSANGMTKNDDGTYSITIDMVAGTYEYKADSGDWTDCYPVVGEPNATVTVATDCAVTFTLDTTAGTITATGDGVEAPVEPDPVVVTSAAVKGTIPGLDWDETTEIGAMTLVDGIYTLTIPAVAASEVGADAYAFKVVANGSWDTAYPESDWTFYLNAECDVTITFNPETYEVTLTADGLTYEAPTDGSEEGGEDSGETTETTYYVAGSMNSWSAAAEGYAMTAVGDGTYTYTFAALAAGTYSLKVTDGTWDNSWTAAEGEYLGTDGNLYFTVTADCDVVVTFDGTNVSVSGDNVTAKAAEALVVDKVVIAGGVTGDDTANPGNMFNGLIWSVNAEYYVNCLYDTEETPGVYSITFKNVSAGSYDFKFVVNDNWAINFATGLAIESGVEATAWFNAQGNSTVVVAEDGSTVTFVLDLTNTVNVGDNATMTVTIEAPVTSDVVTSAPESLVLGKNEFAIGMGDTNIVSSTYTAEADGVLYIAPVAMNSWNSWSMVMEEVPAAYISMQFGRSYGIMVDGVQLYAEYIEVTAGTTYEIGVISYQGNAAEITLNLCTGHNYVDAVCTVCGLECTIHNWDNGVCLNCGATCDHEIWNDAYCANCGQYCEHSWTYTYAADVHTFVCGGVCGQTVTVENTDSKQLKINSAAPVLSDDITLKYRVTVPAGFNGEYAYMTFTMNGETTYVFDYTVETDGKLCFAYPGLNPQKMGDAIDATLYVMAGETQVCVQNLQFSMVKYCNIQMQYFSSNTTLMTILSDLLVYGEKTQVYQGYKTDTLITSLCTGTLTPSTFSTLGSEYNLMAVSGTVDANVRYSSASLILSGKMTLRYTIKTTTPENYVFKISLNGVTYEYTVDDLIADENAEGTYYLDFNKMKATQFGMPIMATIEQDGVQISRAIQYSVYTYVYQNQNTSDVALKELLQAIYLYGESAQKA